MLISFNQYLIHIKKFSDFEEMYNYAELCNKLILLNGKSENLARDCYVLVVKFNDFISQQSQNQVNESLAVAINSIATWPTILTVAEKELIVLGIDTEVIGISLDEKSIIFNIKLSNLPFIGFLHLPERKVILIFYEIGVIAIDYEGNELWGYELDILCNSIIDNNTLTMEFLDLGKITLDITTGKIIEKINN